MKKSLLIFTVLILNGVIFGQSPILGKWCSDKRNSEGLGTVLIFEKNKTVKMVSAVLVDFNFKEKEDSIVFTLPPSENNRTTVINTAPYKFSGDTLLLFPKDTSRIQKLVQLKPVKNVKNKFTGVWHFKHQKGYDAEWQFTKSGIAQLTVYLQTVKGTYSVKKNNLVIKLEKRPPEDPNYVLKGNHLTLKSKLRNSEEEFTRLIP